MDNNKPTAPTKSSSAPSNATLRSMSNNNGLDIPKMTITTDVLDFLVV